MFGGLLGDGGKVEINLLLLLLLTKIKFRLLGRKRLSK